MKLGLFNLATGAACVLVGIQAAGLLSAPTGFAALPAEAAAVQDPPQTERVYFEAPELALFAEIAERPLFSPDRRPPKAKVVVSEDAETLVIRAAVPAERPLQVMLLGVASTNDTQSAILQVDGAGSELLRLGETVQGWTISSIGEDSVVFTRDEERVTALLGEVAEVKVPDSETPPHSQREATADSEPARFLPASAAGSTARNGLMNSFNFQDSDEED